MATEDDIIINLKSDISEGEAAKRKLEDIALATKDLKASFDAGRIGLAAYRAELKELEREAGRAGKALDAFNAAQVASGGQKLSGSDRAGAKARLGLAAANIAQDVIQGGPASAINNILGLAGDTKIRSLVAEFVEGAGGVSGLASKLGAAGAAAAALFGVLDSGLKSAKLEWSDLDDVVGDLGPIKAAREAFVGLGEVARDWHLDAAWEGASGAAAGYVNAIADAVLGWSAATEAARNHKAEVERGVQAARDYAAAAKAAGGIRSDDQQQQAQRGKAVGQELANLGGAGGLDAVARKLAERSTQFGGDEMLSVPKFDDKGKPDGEEQITKREKARRDALTELVAAAGGDSAALGRVRGELGSAGFALGGVDAAAARQPDKDVEADRAERADRANAEAKAKAEREFVAWVKENGLDPRTGEKLLTGRAREEADETDEQYQERHQRERREFQEREANAAYEASKRIADEDTAAAVQDRMTQWRKDWDRTHQSAQVFNGPAALRDAIQTAQRKDNDPTAVEMLKAQRDAVSAANKSNELLQQIANTREVARFGVARAG